MKTNNTQSPRTWIENYHQITINEANIQNVLYFALLWNMFERYMCDKFANISLIETRIEDLAKKTTIDKADFDFAYDFFHERYVDKSGQVNQQFDDLKWKNELAAKDRASRVLRMGSNDSTELLTVLLTIIYRLRNNLFHGNKSVRTAGQQDELFQTADAVLMKVLDIHQSIPPATTTS